MGTLEIFSLSFFFGILAFLFMIPSGDLSHSVETRKRWRRRYYLKRIFSAGSAITAFFSVAWAFTAAFTSFLAGSRLFESDVLTGLTGAALFLGAFFFPYVLWYLYLAEVRWRLFPYR
jgi:hypothetical protein